MAKKHRKAQDRNQGNQNAQKIKSSKNQTHSAPIPQESLDSLLQRAEASPDSLTSKDVTQLQRTIGNRAVGELGDVSRSAETTIQTKLTVGPVGDSYEQEADRVAKQVASTLNAGGKAGEQANPQAAQRQEEEEMAQMQPISTLQRQEEDELMMKPADSLQRQEEEEEEMAQMKPISTLQRQEEDELMMRPADSLQRQEEEEEEMAQMKSASSAEGGPVSANIEDDIRSARGGGAPLSDAVRAPMENAFGADFSGVKVHTDSQSNTLNQSLQARAFTTGQDVFFRQNEYNPGASAGQELLAHELTHVVQQSGSQVQRVEDTVQREDDPETGLARSKSIEKFGGKVQTLVNDWANLNPASRMTGLISAVNIELSKARVPGVKGLAEDCGGAGNAEFDFTTWTVKVDPVTLNQDSVTSAEAAELADAIYHESRHAEQWYRIARLRAGEGLTANQLAKELYIPSNIASQAAGDPLKPLTPEARRVRSEQYVKLHDQTLKEAKAWYKSVYGEDSAHREAVLGDIDNRYDEYRALAEEVDAWAVGTRAQTIVQNLLNG